MHHLTFTAKYGLRSKIHRDGEYVKTQGDDQVRNFYESKLKNIQETICMRTGNFFYNKHVVNVRTQIQEWKKLLYSFLLLGYF